MKRASPYRKEHTPPSCPPAEHQRAEHQHLRFAEVRAQCVCPNGEADGNHCDEAASPPVTINCVSCNQGYGLDGTDCVECEAGTFSNQTDSSACKSKLQLASDSRAHAHMRTRAGPPARASSALATHLSTCTPALPPFCSVRCLPWRSRGGMHNRSGRCVYPGDYDGGACDRGCGYLRAVGRYDCRSPHLRRPARRQ